MSKVCNKINEAESGRRYQDKTNNNNRLGHTNSQLSSPLRFHLVQKIWAAFLKVINSHVYFHSEVWKEILYRNSIRVKGILSLSLFFTNSLFLPSMEVVWASEVSIPLSEITSVYPWDEPSSYVVILAAQKSIPSRRLFRVRTLSSPDIQRTDTHFIFPCCHLS